MLQPLNETMDRFFCRILGADYRGAALLAEAVEIDHNRKLIARAEKQGNEGITFSDMKILVVVAIAVFGLALGSVTAFQRDHLVPLLWTLLAIEFGMILFFAATYLQSMMVADEGYRIVAAWPVSSNTYLTSRLLAPLRGAVLGTLLLVTPSTLVLLIWGGVPILTGLLFFGISLLLAPVLMVVTACVFVLLMRRFEPEQTTVISLLAMPAAMILLVRLLELYGPFEHTPWHLLTYQQLPTWTPHTWLVGVIGLGAFSAPFHHLLLALLGFLAVPALLFRSVSESYTRSLDRSRIHRTKAGGGFWARLLVLSSKRPADRVLASLCLAHGRADWRFRSQLYMCPFMGLGLVLAPLLEFDISAIFANPMTHDGWFNPSMLWMIVVAFPPVIAVRLLATSKDHNASWILRISPIPIEAFAAAQRHVMRVVFVFPILLLALTGYLIFQAPLLPVLAHVAMMALVAEVMVCGMQNLFSDYPFSLPGDDENFMMRLLPILFVYEALSLLISGVIFHLFYRWWWAYVVGAMLLLVMRHFFIRGDVFSHSNQEPKAQEEVQEERNSPLIGAIRAGNYHTVQLLLWSGHPVNEADASGKTPREWAQSCTDPRIPALLDEPPSPNN